MPTNDGIQARNAGAYVESQIEDYFSKWAAESKCGTTEHSGEASTQYKLSSMH